MPGLLPLLQEGGHEAAGAGPFTINGGLILWTLVVFGLLFALLWKFGWPAILKSVEEREARRIGARRRAVVGRPGRRGGRAAEQSACRDGGSHSERRLHVLSRV